LTSTTFHCLERSQGAPLLERETCSTMVGAILVPLMTLVLAISTDAASLVARLSSGTVAEQTEAARQLEAMGREALPTLEAALRSPDAEVRSRVASVWERIQKGLLVRPSMVRLEGEGRALTEVVHSIGEQGGFSLEVSQQGPGRLFDAREPLPLPFWQAVERLGLGGGRFTIANPVGGHFPTLEFSAASEDACPSTISGPFQIKLKGLHDHRDRSLIAGPWLKVDEFNQRIPIDRSAKEREARFFIDLVMMIEPRMWFRQEGPAQAIEAVDEFGQSLVRRDTTRVQADHSLFYNGDGVTEGHVQLDLAMPEKPGRSIVRLRGSVPVAIQIRRPVPALEIPLPAAKDKAFADEDAVFTLREFREHDEGTAIVVDVRINLDRFDVPSTRDGEIVSSRLRCLRDHQVEIVDADGKVLTDSGGGGTMPDGNARMSFMVWKNRTKARPARFRYYRMVRAFTDVAFEFRKIPMP
jgi:hypothetical protein